MCNAFGPYPHFAHAIKSFLWDKLIAEEGYDGLFSYFYQAC